LPITELWQHSLKAADPQIKINMDSLDFSMLEPRHAPAREACGIDAAGALAGGDLKTATFPLPPVADVGLAIEILLIWNFIVLLHAITHLFAITCSWTPSKEKL
jgi:hypothetical protein